jgi:hypothetical protein
MGFRLDGSISIPGMGKIFSLLHSILTSSVMHPASYSMGTSGSFLWGRAAEA